MLTETLLFINSALSMAKSITKLFIETSKRKQGQSIKGSIKRANKL